MTKKSKRLRQLKRVGGSGQRAHGTEEAGGFLGAEAVVVRMRALLGQGIDDVNAHRVRPGGDRPRPLRLALGAFDPAWKKVRVEFELVPAGTAPVFLFVDARRRYGRTAMIGPDGVLNDRIPLEACPELFLLPASPPGK